MGLFDKFKKNKKDNKEATISLYLYDDHEIEIIDEFISDTFGKYESVFHEIASPDIHLDVCLIDPTEDEPYYKLVTMGAGAYRMKIPQEYEKYHIEYAEYVIYLPKDWNINSNKDEDYWPIRLLKNTARLPIWNDTWLSYGHTSQNDAEGTPYASNTRFNGIVLNYAGDNRLIMPNGKIINFYEIIPLYPEELDFKLQNDADTLFEKFNEKNISYKIIDLNRKSAIKNV